MQPSYCEVFPRFSCVSAFKSIVTCVQGATNTRSRPAKTKYKEHRWIKTIAGEAICASAINYICFVLFEEHVYLKIGANKVGLFVGSTLKCGLIFAGDLAISKARREERLESKAALSTTVHNGRICSEGEKLTSYHPSPPPPSQRQ